MYYRMEDNLVGELSTQELEVQRLERDSFDDYVRHEITPVDYDRTTDVDVHDSSDEDDHHPPLFSRYFDTQSLDATFQFLDLRRAAILESVMSAPQRD